MCCNFFNNFLNFIYYICPCLNHNQAFGLHAHGSEGGHGSEGAHGSEGTSGDSHDDHSGENAFIWKALVVLASIYSFYLFETLMHLGLQNRLGPETGHSHSDAEVCR